VSDAAVGPAPLASIGVPAAPVGLVPAPAATPAPTSAQPALPAASRAVARPLAKVSATSRATRITAGVVFCALAAWAWRVLAADGATGVGPDGREALTLHDFMPAGPDSGLRRRFTAGPRTGAPPALR
jgi:hypothetical protein